MTSTIRLLLVSALILAGVAAGYLIGRYAPRNRENDRMEMIRAVTAQAGPGQLLVIGDSIVEMQSLPPMCGRVSLNAGVSGARVDDVQRLAEHAIAAARPSRVVFAIGTNDLLRGPPDPDRWRAAIGRMVATWPGRPVIVGITVTPGPNAATATRMNDILRRLAAQRGGVFVPGLTPAETYDTVHPSLAGAAAWRARVDAGCRALSRP